MHTSKDTEPELCHSQTLSPWPHLVSFSSFQRLEESKRHAHSASSSCRLDQGVQVDFPKDPALVVVSVGTMTEEEEQSSILRERLSQSEEERAGLVEKLSSQEWVGFFLLLIFPIKSFNGFGGKKSWCDQLWLVVPPTVCLSIPFSHEVRRWKRAREEQEEETERWKRQQTREQQDERRKHQ